MGTVGAFKVSLDSRPLLGMWQNMDGYPTGWMSLEPCDEETDEWQDVWSDYEYHLMVHKSGVVEFEITTGADRLWFGLLSEYIENSEEILKLAEEKARTV